MVQAWDSKVQSKAFSIITEDISGIGEVSLCLQGVTCKDLISYNSIK